MVVARADGVSRAAATLIALGSEETLESGGLGVVRVAEITGGDKGHVSRLLTKLEDFGLVERDPDTRGYRLGWQLFALAARAGDQRLLETARPLLARLVLDLGERTNLSVLHGTEVLTVSSQPSTRAVQAADWVGRTVPSYCTSSGRVLLFDHRRDQLTALFAGTQFSRLGPNAPANVSELHQRIVESRSRGFAAVEEEFEPGLVGVAAPVRDIYGRICSAVNVSGPKFRFDGSNRLQAVGYAIKEVADDLSLLLGRGGESRIATKVGSDRS